MMDPVVLRASRSRCASAAALKRIAVIDRDFDFAAGNHFEQFSGIGQQIVPRSRIGKKRRSRGEK